MTPVWHPLSALLLVDPPAFATPLLLRTLLAGGRPVELVYAGDRMWPAVAHGQVIRACPLGGEGPAAGDAVVACPGGIPELLRVEGADGDRLRLRGDSDPAGPTLVARDEVLARAPLPAR